MPLVTIAMSVHNGAATLREAIRSLLKQTFTDWELLIVNDASTDRSLQQCREFHDSRILVIDEPQQRGLGVRLNQCVERAKGKYIARMDADDIAYPQRFERQVQYLEAHSDINLLGHRVVLFQGEGQVIGAYPMVRCHEEICCSTWWGFPLAHPTWMGQRSWFLQHRYREDLIKGQDQELLLRTYRSSRFAALSDILLGYRVNNISVKKTWRGRLNYCHCLFKQVSDVPSALIAVRGLLVHSLVFSRDVLFATFGNWQRWSRSSIQPATDQMRTEWKAVWDHTRDRMP